MQVIYEKPPNYNEILAAFPAIAGKQMFFAFGDKIYAPHRPRTISRDLQVHESAHGVRQFQMGVLKWWDHYLLDTEFRLAEEVIAYGAQYAELCKIEPSRHARRGNLVILATQLASPIYGNLVSRDKAKRLIADAAEALQGQVDGGA